MNYQTKRKRIGTTKKRIIYKIEKLIEECGFKSAAFAIEYLVELYINDTKE